MKKIYLTLSIMLLATLSVFGQKLDYVGNIEVKTEVLEQRGDSIYINVLYNIKNVKMNPVEVVSLVPELVAIGNSYQLPRVDVMGRNSFNMYRRQLALMSNKEFAEYEKTAPLAVVKASSAKKSSLVEYSFAIPFEEWMADARLDIKQYSSGCGSTPELSNVALLANNVALAELYAVTPYLTYITPKVEAIKRREMAAEVYLNFIVSRIKIVPTYMNNTSELAKITDMIAAVNNDSNVTVRSVSVEGYASPEGTFYGNKKLSEGRANTLVDYLLPNFDYSREYYKIKFGGENWSGLYKMVEASDMKYKSEVLKILSKVSYDGYAVDNEKIKRQLKDLRGGKPYAYMLKEFYPSLRKAICWVDYEVKGFEVVEAKEVIKTNPQNLSLNEMYLVANTYEKGSAEFVEVFETAAKVFPKDQIANLNAAAAALSRSDVVSAERYLANVKEVSPEYNNAMGVLYLLKGDYYKSTNYLKAAEAQGLEVAKSNLAELDIKVKESKK